MFSVVMWLALPILVVGFSLINAGLINVNPARPLGPATFSAAIIRAVGLGAVAIVAHGFILLFGGRILDGIGYDIYKLRQIQLRRRRDRCERRIAAETRRVEGGFRNFYNGFNNNDNGNESGGGAGPFGATTRTVVNDVFDDDIIEDPRQQQDPDNTARSRRPDGHGRPTAEPMGTEERDHGDRDVPPGTGAVPPRPFYDTDGEDQIRR
jgi:hypothetical protein